MAETNDALIAKQPELSSNHAIPCDALDVVYGPTSEDKVAAAKVLVVGAGGVGCELLKNLASVGFTRITVIDLDTIDFSNLNRQFLFRRKHVGKSKAEEAAATVQAMFPRTTITPMMANIKEPRFHIAFYKDFTLVCNALDNLEARRHVNSMCLAAKVPLVESGSTGYNGQCVVIGEGAECYDCLPREPPKSHAVCSIRSTPEQPVHCIVWAKALFELIFGEPDEGNVLRDLDAPSTSETPTTASETSNEDVADAENDGAEKPSEIVEPPAEGDTTAKDATAKDATAKDATAKDESSTQLSRKSPKRVRFLDTDTPSTFVQRVCERVFFEEIEEQAAMKDRWTSRDPPVPIDVNKIVEKEGSIAMSSIDVLEQEVWSVEHCARVVHATLEHLVTNRKDEMGKLQFDKDDDDALAFVAAAGNLRAKSYGVKLSSPFSTKGIAGNIVHAIATTNAMIGGLIVLEALKITTSGGKLDGCVSTFVTSAPSGSRVKKLLTAERLRPPNKKCVVCSKDHLVLSVDVDKIPLRDLVASVVQARLNIADPSILVTTGNHHNTVYECGVGLDPEEELEYEANLKKTLRSLRIEAGSQLSISGLTVKSAVVVHIHHVAGLEDDENGDKFRLSGNVERQNCAKTSSDKSAGNAIPNGSEAASNGTCADGATDIVDLDDEAELVVTPDTTMATEKPKAARVSTEQVVVANACTKEADKTEASRKRDVVAVEGDDNEAGPDAKKQRSN